MLRRYVLGKIPNRTDDVLPHADGEVCLPAAGPSRSGLMTGNNSPKLTSRHHAFVFADLVPLLSHIFP